MSKNEEQISEWKEFRKSVYENKLKSEDDYEKYLTLISSGALALSITFIEKIVNLNNATCKVLLIAGWVLLTITLLGSLLSHFFSRKYSEKTINDIDDTNIEFEVLLTNLEKRNSILEYFNVVNIGTLFSGIILIIIFISTNILIMNNNQQKPRPSDQPKPRTQEVDKGRTIPKPTTSKPNSSPKK
jgi:hypothetical protein